MLAQCCSETHLTTLLARSARQHWAQDGHWCTVRVTRATVYEPFLINYRNADVWQLSPPPPTLSPIQLAWLRALTLSVDSARRTSTKLCPGLVFLNFVFRFAGSAGGVLALLGVTVCFKVRLIFVWYVTRNLLVLPAFIYSISFLIMYCVCLVH
jgi:hypothetical protein